LKENGFSGIDVNLIESFKMADRTRQAIVTTFGKVPTTSFGNLTTLLILDSNSEYQRELGHLVESLLTANGSNNVEQVFVEDLASIPSFEQTICVFFVEIEHPFLKDISSPTYNAVRRPLSTAKVAVWLDGGGGDLNASPDFALIDGLARVLRVENEELKFISAKLENGIQNLEEQSSSILKIFKSIDVQSNTQNYEANFLEVASQLFICRLLEDVDLTEKLYSKAQPQQTRVQEFGSGPPLTLSIGVPGMLDTFRFIEDSGPLSPLLADELEVKVSATGLNFKDLLQALGRVNGTKFGNECAGIIHRAGTKSGFQPGERVCLPVLGAFSTYVRAKAVVVARVPEEISMVEAATIPIQFGTAYCSIHELAHMQKGESILIHSGAGGTGQAAIQLAKLLDAEIFVTVGSESKRKFLIDEYAIAEDHIFYSRNTTFAAAVKRMTNGRGVDVVLNSLSGEGLMSSWDCIAPYGRFIELGRREMQTNAGLPMAPFLRNASFIPFEGAMFALDRPSLCRSSVEAVLSLFVQKKARPPQPLQVSNISEIQKTMRLLQSGNTMGKFVLEMTDEAVVPV
jgi:NADPH:quinone reductase-like Zn-dependent oxidoreductase